MANKRSVAGDAKRGKEGKLNIERHEELTGEGRRKLTRDLMTFIRPYRWSFFATLLLVAVATVMELLNPYLIKIAIDEHISGDVLPMVEVQTPGDKTLMAGGRYFIRLSEASDTSGASATKTYTIERDASDTAQRKLVGQGESIPIDPDAYRAFREHDLSATLRLSLLYLAAVLILFAANWISNYLLGRAGAKVIYDIRKRLFNHLSVQSSKFYDANPVGRLLTRVLSDTAALNEVYSSVLVSVIADAGILVGIVILMVQLQPKLALMCSALIPLIFAVSLYFRNVLFAIYQKGRRILSEMNTSLNEYLSGMSIIRIFGKQRKIEERFDAKNAQYYRTMLRQIKKQALFRPSVEMIRSLGEAFLIWYGGGEVLRDTIPFGTLFLFMTYLKKFFQPISDITEKYNIYQHALASGQKIFSLLAMDTQIKKDPSRTETVPAERGDIEFSHVCFSYIEGEPVLRDVSFKIRRGESVAFVGATGAGKTSIISLLSRLYDVKSGHIFLGGHDIRSMETDVLRGRIGTVLQDVFLFAGDIRTNITLGYAADDAEIQRAAKRVHADRFIERLPEGYDTAVTERGSTLSSGERQLLSFARALLRDPEILILDEATASIDTETELLIQDGLKELMRGRTTIAIAHRLSTIQGMDRIIVMDKGRIIEEGTHEELLRKQGAYYTLYRLQLDEEERRTARSQSE